MKILFSGFRKKLFKDESSLFGDFMEESDFLQSDQTLAAIYKAAVAGGHKVEGPRMIRFQEDLSPYDCVISEMSVPNVFGANGLVNMLWAVHEYRKVAFVIGHWDIKSMYGGINQLLKKPEKMFGGFIEYDDSLRYPNPEFVTTALQMILDGTVPSAINAWDWGDKELLKTKHFDKFKYFFDPTSLVTSPPFIEYISPFRENKWVTGTFEPFAVKQIENTPKSWPSEVYGFPKETKLTPNELFHQLSGARGSFVHGYHHAGSGYYRSRYQQCLNVGTILCHLSPEDRRALQADMAGNPLATTLGDIEHMENWKLEKLLDDQRIWFEANTWTEGPFIDWVNETFLPEVSRL